MKKNLLYTLSALFISVSLVSCGGGDDDTTGGGNSSCSFKGARRVFGPNLLKESSITYKNSGNSSILTTSYTYDANGYLTRISLHSNHSDSYINIDYSINNTVLLYKKNADGTPIWKTTVVVGNNGFAKSSVIADYENGQYVNKQASEYSYNSDNQIKSINYTTNKGKTGNSIFTYFDKNIVNRRRMSEGLEISTQTVLYEYSSNVRVENTYSLMDYEDLYPFDLDEDNYLIPLGLLGYPTKNLPYKFDTSYPNCLFLILVDSFLLFYWVG